MLFASVALIALTTASHREPAEVRLAKEYLEVIQTTAVEDVTQLAERTLPYQAAEYVRYPVPTTLKIENNALLALFFVDPLVEFKITITDWLAKRTKAGMTVALEGYGRGLTTAGLVYNQEYRFTFVFNHDKKIVSFTEFLDGFATACFMGKIPMETCTANGLQGRPM